MKRHSISRTWRKTQQAWLNFIARPGISRLRNAYAGHSLFLVGSAPSLRNMDLRPLQENDRVFMTVNNAFRLFPSGRIPMHAVSDAAFITMYAKDLAAAPIERGFYRTEFQIMPACRQVLSAHQSVFIPFRRGGVLKRGFQTRLARGVGHDSTVLLFAAQIAFHLGFQNVFVMGCDLDYSEPQKYAYDMSPEDAKHEAEARVRRVRMEKANDEFAIAREAFEYAGRRIANCGLGGRLNALERVRYEDALGVR